MLLFLRYAMYVPTLIFLIQAIVTLIESVKAGEPGEDKKAAAIKAIEDNWVNLSREFKITLPFAVLKPVISFLIDLTISVYNMTGHFTKKSEPVITEVK